MKYLGIDYGTKRVGLAISDDGGLMAYPREVLKNSQNLANDVSAVVDRESIDEIVIGYSVDEQGNENQLMEDIRDLVGQLSLTVGLPVHMESEAFTSVEAARLQGFDGLSGRRQANQRGRQKKGEHIDDSAAALLLQRFLDKQK